MIYKITRYHSHNLTLPRSTCLLSAQVRMAATPKPEEAFLSGRSSRALQPALPYFSAFIKAQQRLWSPEDQDGYIINTVAENKLSHDLLRDKLQQLEPMPLSVFGYPKGMAGTPELRSALATLLQDSFMAGLTVDPDHLCVSAGAGSIVDLLFHCIASRGDGALLPVPYYPAFDNDLQVRAGVQPVPFDLDTSGDIGAQLSQAAAASEAQGHPIRALIVTNPSNPLGTIYPSDALRQMLRWCLDNRVHLVSDEIYANSIFDEAGGPQFRSLAHLVSELSPGSNDAALAQQLAHVVWGLSKDFCASGLRVGCLWTRNSALLQAYGNLGYFCSSSHHTQWMVTQLLQDRPFVASFLLENKGRLARSYNTLSAALTKAGIGFVPACSAMFVWLDLRHLLAGPSFEAEWALWNELVDVHRLILTPGATCHAREPGFFRMCYAWVPTEALPSAVQRIQQLQARRATN